MIFFVSNLALELMLSGTWWVLSKSVKTLGHYVVGYVFKTQDKTYIVYEERWNKLIEQNETQKKEIERLRIIVENWIERGQHPPCLTIEPAKPTDTDKPPDLLK
jgi:hypothetical protein